MGRSGWERAGRAWSPLTLGCALGACGSPAPASPPAETAQTKTATARAVAGRAAPKPVCATIDTVAFLHKHAREFGEPAAVADELPRTFAGSISRGGHRGSFELVLDRTRHRSASWMAGAFTADGVDDRGAWALGTTGVVERTAPAEAVGTRFDAWLWSRGYVIRGLQLALACELSADGAPRAVARFDAADLGNPRLSFDLETGALVEAQHTSADGQLVALDLTAWTVKDAHGVRWPSALRERRPVSEPTETHVTTNTPGLACVPQLDKWAPRSTDCLAPPTPTLTFVWPERAGAPHRPTPLDPTRPQLEVAAESGNAGGVPKPVEAPPDVVRTPMYFGFGQPMVRVRVADRDAWAVLDSGAALSFVDGGSALAGSLGPTREISNVRVGGVTVLRLPATEAPMPGWDAFAPHRPELVLGYSLFAALGVRVDYAAQEIALATSADRLRDERAIGVPVRELDGKMLVEAKLDGISGAFEVATGTAAGFELSETWAAPHGLPGSRPTLTVEGGGEDKRVLFRAAHGELGPIAFGDHVVKVRPSLGPEIAGRVGNEVFSRCRAVIFDLAHRKLWLEPPCDRPIPEPKGGFRLERHDDAAFPEQPWVVVTVFAGGSAARAGIEVGDRLLSLDGKPAGADGALLLPPLARPAGTRVALVVERRGEKKKIAMELVRVP